MKPGDIIKYRRRCINHYAIYVGNDEIIHRTDDDGTSAHPGSFSSGSGKLCDKAVIRRDHWKAPIEEYGWAVDNYYDSEYKPLPPDEIVRRAKSRLGTTGYNIFLHNCEHFVTWCRYGEKKTSREVTHKIAGVGLSVGTGLGTGVGVGAAVGATTGSVLGPIGIAIGAGVGSALGFFGIIGSRIKP